MMTEISHRLRKKEDWVVIELNPATDLLQGMLSKLNSNQVCAGIIKSAKIDLHFFDFGVFDRRSSSNHRYRDGYYCYFGENEKERKTPADHDR